MKLIILDRDGVINEDSDDYIKSPEEFNLIPGSLQAIARLKRASYTVVIATNQSAIARGLMDIEILNQIHKKLCHELENLGASIDAIFFCPHGPKDMCHCRKPKPGLFLDIKRRLQVDLIDVLAVGDSLRDVQAAQSVSASPVLVKTGKGLRTISAAEGLEGVPIFEDLAAVVDMELAKNESL